MRDEVRALAEVTGPTSMTGLINNIIQESLDALTGLARYDECYVPATILTVDADGIVSLPTDLQHFDEKEMFYRIDNQTDIGNRYRLKSYARVRSTEIGRPAQFRFYGTGTSGAIIRKMLITPIVDIDATDDRIEMNYWRKLTFATDGTEVPILKLAETIILKTAARVAKQSNTKLSQKLSAQARDAYTAARASSIVY